MNHDATHCFDYDPKICPKSCYRAELTEDLKHISYGMPTSWSHFKNTVYCPRWPNKEKK